MMPGKAGGHLFLIILGTPKTSQSKEWPLGYFILQLHFAENTVSN